MKYFLKKTKPSKKGEYLQIYISQYIPGKGSRNPVFLGMSSRKFLG